MALHRAKEAILITDDTLRTQYANKATERLLNMKLVSRFILGCYIENELTCVALLG